MNKNNTETNIVDTGLRFKGHKILLAPRNQHKADCLVEQNMSDFIEQHFPAFLRFDNNLEFKDYDPHTQS